MESKTNVLTPTTYTFESPISRDVPSHQERFYENLIDFGKLVTELITLCHERGFNVVHPQILGLGISYVAGMDKIKLIENFIEYSKHVWEKIIVKDETFFSDKENGKKLFSELPNVVEHIYVLLVLKDKAGNPVITPEDKAAIWNYADSWIKICIKYIHDKRKPILVSNGKGQYEKKYQVRYQTDIKLSRFTDQYGVELEWA